MYKGFIVIFLMMFSIVQANGLTEVQVSDMIMLAEQGDVDAQFYLGEMYYFGYGVEEDDAEAMRWYSQAAEQGDVEAQLYLDWMYENDYGEEEEVTGYRETAGQVHAMFVVRGDNYDEPYLDYYVFDGRRKRRVRKRKRNPDYEDCRYTIPCCPSYQLRLPLYRYYHYGGRRVKGKVGRRIIMWKNIPICD